MSSSKDMASWIESFKKEIEYRGEPHRAVAVQAEEDGGDAYCVVFHRETGNVIRSGVKATSRELEVLEELGVLEDEVEGR